MSLRCKEVFGLSVVVCFAKIFICTCAVQDYEVNLEGVNASCKIFCWNNSLGLNDSDPDSVVPNCTEHCTYAAYTCPDGFISIQTPQPRCIPFVVCNGTNPCQHGNCLEDFNECRFGSDWINGSEATPCCLEVDCAVKQCDQGCVNTTNSTECSCIPGFILEDDGFSSLFDNSSALVGCDINCFHGLCLNETCYCFPGYSLDENATCTVQNSSDECISKLPVCENCTAVMLGNRTHRCRNATISVNGTCRESDACSSPSARNSCERRGKRCRPNDDGDFECYCGLPHHLISGISPNESFCVFPATRFFMYRLSLVLVVFCDDGYYALMRRLEEDFINNFFPNIVNCTVLNLEVASLTVDPIAPIAYLSLSASFTEELAYLGELLFEICSTYPHLEYEDACVLPGNIIVRRSQINYTEIENVCAMDDAISNFLCGSLAKCDAGEGMDRYECNCIEGYQIDRYASPMKPTCVDVDECLEHPCTRPNQICKNRLGNYSCDCIPCYLWNETRNACASLCESNPCEHNGVCILNELQTGCGFHCTCRDEFKGPTCSEINDAIRAAKTNVAITGGILGAILGLTIITAVLIIYMILKRTGYFSFRLSKVSLT